ncbi:DNA double-strand break repair nuclease NurA [Halanaerobaculum tunisiense]
MLEVSPELKDSLQDCNQKLQDKYQHQSNLTAVELKELITKQVGEFSLIKELDSERLQEWTSQGPIIGVDGSVNTTGKVYPHYITLLQALAKSSTGEEDIINHEIFSPLIAEDKEKIFKKINKEGNQNAQEVAGKIRTSLLAALEIKVAQQAIIEYDPQMVMMDGSLIRYYHQAEDLWQQLVDWALEKEVLLVGVIEEIATHQLSQSLEDELPSPMQDMYDRELLFGLLKPGEGLYFDSQIEFKPGLETVFLRSSQDPGVIGVDLLEEQQDQLEFAIQTVYSLTPQTGRGIPIWLDIVDNEVRLTDQMIEVLLDNYLAETIKQRLFHSKRQDRIF